MTRYDLAAEHECGEQYRPGELSIPDLNYCRLRPSHGGMYHSTRTGPNDSGGYEWLMDEPDVDIDWALAVPPTRED